MPEEKAQAPASHEMGDHDLLFWQEGSKEYMLLTERDDDVPDPRKDSEPVTRMICRHKRRSLGDYPQSKPMGQWWAELIRDAVPREDLLAFLAKAGIKGHPARNDLGIDPAERFLEAIEYQGIPTAQWMPVLDGYAVRKPIWAYEHSGIAITIGKREYPFNDRFDSGQLGWIAMTKQDVLRNWPDEADWQAKALEVMESDIGVYGKWLDGDVWWFRLYERDVPPPEAQDSGEYDGSEWDEIDSCGGFYGQDVIASGMAWHAGHGMEEAVRSGRFGTGRHSVRSQPVDEFHRD